MTARFTALARRPASAWAPRAVLALVALALASLAVAPRAARADDHLWSTWGACALGGGTHDVTFSCGDLFATHSLVCSFMLAAPIDSVIGVELVVDVQCATDTLPAYWHLDTGGCNANQLLVSFPAPGACADPWGGHAGGLLQEAVAGQPRGGASQVRLKVVATVPANQARTLDAGVVYDALQLDFANERLSRCDGCQTPACLVLNSILLLRPPGSAAVLVPGDGSATDNLATWQGGLGADCNAVPARPRTWGAVKVLYR